MSLNLRRRNQSGQGMLEYILIVVFVVVAGIALWKIFGNRIRSLVETSTTSIEGAVEGAPCVNSQGQQSQITCKDPTKGCYCQ